MTKTIEPRKAPWPIAFYRSAVGKKWVMAITGIGLILFLLAHMIGNWKVFLPDVDGIPEINIYAEALRSFLFPYIPETVVLWILRTGLALFFLLHIHAAYSLTVMNHRARPDGYQSPRHYLAANYASRTMRWSGSIFFAFLVFHLADFTWGLSPAAPDGWVRLEVYSNMIASFSRPLVAIFYVVAVVILAIHLYHGAWSMFQSVGANHPLFNRIRRWFAVGLAVLIAVGNSIMPLSVLFGWVS